MDVKFDGFHRVLDPEDNQTGGGAASAVAGAMAASLIGMVARLSIGKKNMPEDDAYYVKINERAVYLSELLMQGSLDDSQAFDEVMAAYRLPRQTDDEKTIRLRSIQEATILATKVPLRNAENCVEVLRMAAKLVGKSNRNAASDLECALFLGRAGLKGMLSNAVINVDSVRDPKIRKNFEQKILEFRSVMAATENS